MELNSMQTDPKIQWHGLLDTTWDIISKFECNYQTLCLPLLLLSKDQAMTLCVSKLFVFCFLRRIHVYTNSLSLGMCLEVVLHAHCPKHIPAIISSETKDQIGQAASSPLWAAKRAIHPSIPLVPGIGEAMRSKRFQPDSWVHPSVKITMISLITLVDMCMST